MSKPFYITTTLPYVNADPHIGFALEAVQADIIARYRMLCGDDVFFNTGTDEHGQKIYEAAKKVGKEPREYVDEYAAKFRSLNETLGLFPDVHFIRTTDKHHEAAAQEIWRRCAAAGDIYKKAYTGLYCVGCEAFKTDKEVVDGICVLHPTLKLAEVSEENYFFRLSKYQQRLHDYLSHPGVIAPEWRREEALKFVDAGLEDFSISRQKRKTSGALEHEWFGWGIPVPEDDSQVMYVWFDALTNYISTLGWPDDAEGNFKKYWEQGETLQLAGKDQVRFQSIMWQAMLMSAGLPTTKRVFYHGFVTSGGQKMSKSLGNVIDPLALQREYGTDALRYFLARHMSPFEDSDFTMERFKDSYNADLANGLGNLSARIFKMAQQYGVLENAKAYASNPIPISEAWANLQAFNFSRAMEHVWELIARIDKFITDEKPFVTFKTNPEKARQQVLNALMQLRDIAITIEPIMPLTSKIILTAMKSGTMPNNLFPRKE